ncbi:MAG: methylated-DNA--[protein]-cysteine S-methyltransferase [Acidipropionibacterium acidipropionici]|nr:methylated-DNA--[protein]-cysteine S-methyltransferase [Acidipropionibacterium acidipropionici]
MTITDEFPVAEPDLTQLRSRLAAEAGDLIDIAYRTLDSPVGDLLLAATRPSRVRVAFRSQGFDAVLEDLAERIGARVLEAPVRLDAAAIQFDEYFRGERRSFDLPLDRSLSIGFRGEVQAWLPHIGYGHTLSYKQVAEQVGRPKAVRAVGTACAHNPLPVVVPCHRVVRGDGGLGGYLGGLEAKRTLLALEAA